MPCGPGASRRPYIKTRAPGVTGGAGTSGTVGIVGIAEVLDPELWRFTLRVMRDGRWVTVEVTADGAGLVSHAGTALLGQVADTLGLTSALSLGLGVLKCKSHQGWFRSLRRAMGGW